MVELLVKLMLILLIALFLAGIVLQAGALLSYFTGGAPFAPTPITALDTLLALADIRPGERVYDLGCGDGRLLIEANKTCQARAVGIEISALFCWIARIKAKLSQADITVIHADMMAVDFSDADVVFCYLMPGQMKKLKPHFARLKKGSRIVSLRFEVPGWEPLCRLGRNDPIGQPAVFKYRI